MGETSSLGTCARAHAGHTQTSVQGVHNPNPLLLLQALAVANTKNMADGSKISLGKGTHWVRGTKKPWGVYKAALPSTHNQQALLPGMVECIVAALPSNQNHQ
jgi:hypothetical protein